MIGTCFCWGVDNNLTRKVASDPLQIAATKGLVAGVGKLGISRTLRFEAPDAATVLTAGAVGFCGYRPNSQIRSISRGKPNYRYKLPIQLGYPRHAANLLHSYSALLQYCCNSSARHTQNG